VVKRGAISRPYESAIILTMKIPSWSFSFLIKLRLLGLAHSGLLSLNDIFNPGKGARGFFFSITREPPPS